MVFRKTCLFVAAMVAVMLARAGATAEEPIKPLPPKPALDAAKVELGRKLFNEPRLSRNGTTSCAKCHVIEAGGADGLPRSVGFSGQQTGVNTPTVLNAALNFRQFWDGRSESLEAQIDAVVVNPVEMGSKWEDVVRVLSEDTAFKREFSAAYKDGVTKPNLINALATFERSLLTPSRFDRYLLGDAKAISPDEKSGYEKFKQYGCIACHQGVNVGGNMFQRFGVMGDYFKTRGGVTERDLGRFNVTRKDVDRHVFKVPGLRNVALTAPYFHDGSVKTLDEAVDIMFRFQLGRAAPREDKELIVKFLGTLSAEQRGKQP